jgi:hypothetical protein
MKLITAKYLSNFLLLLINFALYILSVVIFKNKIKKFSFEKSFIIGIILTILFSVHALSHDLMVLLIPIFILLNFILKDVKKISISYLSITLLLFFLPLSALVNGSVIGVALLIVIVALMLFVIKDHFGNTSALISRAVL